MANSNLYDLLSGVTSIVEHNTKHTLSGDIHVTKTQKDAWDAKQNAIDASNKLDYAFLSGEIPGVLSSGTNVTVADNKINLNDNVSLTNLSATLVYQGGKQVATQEWVEDKKYITSSYVNDRISDIISGAPECLDTLNEIAIALSGDANFASTIISQLALKQDNLTTDQIAAIAYVDTVSGKVPGYDAHITSSDIHVTVTDKDTWNAKSVVSGSTTNGKISINGVDTTVYELPTDIRAVTITSGSVADSTITANFVPQADFDEYVNEVEADLDTISGAVDTKQDAISSSNKLSAAYIATDSNNQFVTSSQVADWDRISNQVASDATIMTDKNILDLLDDNGYVELDGDKLPSNVIPEEYVTSGTLETKVTAAISGKMDDMSTEQWTALNSQLDAIKALL